VVPICHPLIFCSSGWGPEAMYLGNLAQDLQHGYDSLKAVMRQAPWETASSLIKGLESGSIKNAVIHSTVKNTVKFARGNWLDKGAVWGTFVGEVLQLGFAEGDFAKAGEMSNIVKAGTQAEKISGSYLLEFQSGKFYAGKGLGPRMMQSIKRIETTYGDKLLNN